ncbi:hypothetical protein CGC48_00825 [Capnocytophaga cynodegmi]|uniref:Uncharacterized protein n=1 Tax=Capnocytophaga cynodegmi TaxID=28189 RepID=A0A250E6C2_9FLAO|nr:hypothetical protein [Capnocytophaga cynodegmi]ATA67288.1 hypothetical protein CGC48_00825 [Capnocytophaga cynodegmi]
MKEQTQIEISVALLLSAVIVKALNHKSEAPSLLLGAARGIAQNVANNTTDKCCENGIGDFSAVEQKTQTNEEQSDQKVMNQPYFSPISVYVFSFFGLHFFPLFRKRIDSVEDITDVFRIQQFINVMVIIVLFYIFLLIFHR